MRKRFPLIFLSLALLLAVSAGTWQPGLTPAYGSTATGLQTDFIRVAQMVMPSVVSLKAIKVVTMQPPPGGEDFFRGTPFEGTFREGAQPIRRRQVGQGSGVIIDPAGLYPDQQPRGGRLPTNPGAPL